MTETRLIELEMIANANAGTRSAPLILELVEEVRLLQGQLKMRKERAAKRSGFVPPTIEEVAEFFRAGNVFTNGTAAAKADEFWNFYQSKNWVVGRVRMSDWKASARLWESRARSAAPVLARVAAEPRL